MGNAEALRQTVAEFFHVSAEEVTPEFSLVTTRLKNSIGRYALDAAIRRRNGVRCAAVYTARTFGELIAEYDSSIDVDTLKHSQRNSTPSNLQVSEEMSTGQIMSEALGGCGIDIQSVDELPDADDYWTDAFYTSTFSPAEIAYCLAQQEPRVHFAARWCAKESLKKCSPAYLERDMSTWEVAHTTAGEPVFMEVGSHGSRRIPYSLSLSHCGDLAVAIVIRESRNAQFEMPLTAPSSPVIESQTNHSEIVKYQPAAKFTLLAMIFSLLSLLLAALSVHLALGQ